MYTYEGEDSFVVKLKLIAENQNPNGFIQISRLVVVNYQFVNKYSRDEIILSNHEKITIPKNKLTKVKEGFFMRN